MNIKRSLRTLALILIVAFAAVAHAPAQTQSPSPRVAVERDQVTVAAQGVAQQFRAEVFSPGGELVFDSGFANSQPVSWDMKDSQGQPVPEGVYVVLISAVNANGKVRKMIEQVIVWRKPVGDSSKTPTAMEQSASSDLPTPKAIQDSAGTTGKIAKWVASDTLGDSVITEDVSKIGIANQTPTATLHVDAAQPRVGLSDGTNAVTLLQTSGGKGGDANGLATGGKGADIALLAGNGGDAPLGTSGNGGNVTIQAGSPGTGVTLGQSGRVLIAPFVGRVGIGTVNPNEKLTVEGNIQITGNGNGLKFPDNTVQNTAAMTAVATNATLTGDGTGGSPLSVADQGIDTAQLKDGGVTDQKIAAGQIVKSLNTLKDDVTLAAGDNVTITPGGNTLTIAAAGGLGAVTHNATLNGDGTNGNPLGVSVPLSLSGSDAGAILSVANGGSGPAITAGGVINTSTHYSIGGNRVLSVAGVFNVFGGVGAGASNTTGSQNTFVGDKAGFSNTAGVRNTFFGAEAGQNNTFGAFNSFFGFEAGRNNTTSGGNSFFGRAAGRENTTGGNNSFFGREAGQNNMTGGSNSFFGSEAGQNNTSGDRNSFFGRRAGFSNEGGDDNTFFGAEAGRDNTIGENNSFFGRNAGLNNTSGDGNSFFGRNAGFANTNSNSNSFFGDRAGASNTGGDGNAFFGTAAGNFNTDGSLNSFFGPNAGLLNTTGDDNSFFGASAGISNTIGVRNTFIGVRSDGTSNLTNATAIGWRAKVEQNNSVVLGSINGVNGANATVSVGIGTTTPQARLHVVGNAIITGNLSKGGGSFKIDHPLDPANKYLSHSFVESPDMMNIYNGVVRLDRRGRAVVTLPAWFESLNRDFRYQLTPLGRPAPNLYIAREVRGNTLEIAGGRAGMNVSWQVTGIRRDAYANVHRIAVEEDKPPAERGTYLHPELFGQTAEKAVGPSRAPGQTKSPKQKTARR